MIFSTSSTADDSLAALLRWLNSFSKASILLPSCCLMRLSTGFGCCVRKREESAEMVMQRLSTEGRRYEDSTNGQASSESGDCVSGYRLAIFQEG